MSARQSIRFAMPARLATWRVREIVMALTMSAVAAGGFAQESGGLPPRALPPAGNVIRIWGDDAMRGVLGAWQNAFAVRHPEVRIEEKLFGSGTGMAGIITGVAQMAVMGRAATANEVMGFEWVYRYKPRAFEVLTGSVATRDASPALAVFVHRDNPVERLTLQELAEILGCCHAGQKITTWGQLGAGGSWERRQIHAYTYNCESGTGAFLQRAILGNGDKWDWQTVREFGDFQRPGLVADADREIMSTFERDPDGIAMATLRFVSRDAKPVALAARAGGNYFLPSQDRIQSRDYPLSRSIYIYVNAPPDVALGPSMTEFLSFVLSREGQTIAAHAGSFLPLPASMALQEQLELNR